MQTGNIDFIAYVEEMQGQLSRMASKRKLLTLAYFLQMASLEAEEMRVNFERNEAKTSSVEIGLSVQ